MKSASWGVWRRIWEGNDMCWCALVARLTENLRVRGPGGMRVIALAGVLLALGGCYLSPSARMGDQLLGTWETTLAGMPVTISYAAETVTVRGSPPQSYVFAADVLQVADMQRRISFPDSTTMLQTDAVSGVVQRFVRQSSEP
jgi:hypothetical protein